VLSSIAPYARVYTKGVKLKYVRCSKSLREKKRLYWTQEGRHEWLQNEGKQIALRYTNSQDQSEAANEYFEPGSCSTKCRCFY
jgi:hypothetical protein